MEFKSLGGLGFGAGEGIRILDPLNLCFIGFQKLKNYIESIFKNSNIYLFTYRHANCKI